MEGTFIKLDRKILKWEWFDDSKMVHLFIYLLLKANHKDAKWKGILIKRGQLLTGRSKLASTTGLSEMQVRTCLKKLKITNEITIKTTNRNSIITICKYDVYQENKIKSNQPDNQQNDQKITTKQPTDNQPDNQQITTNKNNKEYKNEKNEKEFTKNINTAVGGENDFDINFLLNPPSFPTWRKEVSDFLADEYFIQQFVKTKKLKYAEVVGLMRNFVTDLNLNGDFKKVSAMKVHFKNHYKKHYENGIRNSGSLSNGYVEMPQDFDYESENVVTW